MPRQDVHRLALGLVAAAEADQVGRQQAQARQRAREQVAEEVAPLARAVQAEAGFFAGPMKKAAC